jgi:hypothetical protein
VSLSAAAPVSESWAVSLSMEEPVSVSAVSTAE